MNCILKKGLFASLMDGKFRKIIPCYKISILKEIIKIVTQNSSLLIEINQSIIIKKFKYLKLNC